MDSFPDLTVEFDPKLFDQLVSAALNPSSEGKDKAEAALLKFKEHPDALVRIDAIMSGSKLQESRFIAMQILEENVKARWTLLTEAARASVRQYVFSAVTGGSSAATDIVLHKLNAVLVEIVKKDWPQRWPTFINDLIAVSQNTSMAVASNALLILREVNEQVFLMEHEMTAARRRFMQETLCKEYFAIFRFISTILEYSESHELDESLLKNCLSAFCSFCKSMPLKFVFSTRMVECIIGHLNSPHSVAALECLTEIASLPRGAVQDPSAVEKILLIYTELTGFFKLYLGKFDSRSQLHSAYRRLPEEEKVFLKRYAVAFSVLFSRWFAELGTGRVEQGLHHFAELSRIDDRSFFLLVFPTWSRLISDFYNEYPLRLRISRPLARDAFEPVLKSMFSVFISHMPRPGRVFIRVNDLGEVIRDRRIETSEIEFSKKMQQNLFSLSFMIGDYMKGHLEEALSRYIGSGESTAHAPDRSITRSEAFSKHCWAVGALAGAFDELEERTFFVKIIQTLLTVCELRFLKEEKAVIASNIMFIIGQYHRFLKHNTEFLAVVLRKLFEFMQETFEGIREMACDNFFRICESCPTHLYLQDVKPTIFDSVVAELGTVKHSLDFSLQRTVLEGLLLVVQNGPRRSTESVARIYATLTNERLLSDPSCVLRTTQEELKELVHLIESYAIGLRTSPSITLQLISLESFFSLFSELAAQGAQINPKAKEILRRSLANLFIAALKAYGTAELGTEPGREVFVEKVHALITGSFQAGAQVPLGGGGAFLDIATAVIECSSSEATTAIRIRDTMTVMMVPSMGYVQKADENPEEAASFLRLLTAMVTRAFSSSVPLLLALPARDTFMNSVFLSLTSVWEVSSLCLRLILILVQKCRDSGVGAFFELYYFTILENLLGLVFDRDMRKTYEQQVELLHELMGCARAGMGCGSVKVTSEMVRLFIQRIFSKNFSNVTQKSLDLFITGLLEIKDLGALKDHLDDFNIKINEYGDDSDIVEEEAMLYERVKI